MGVPTSQAGGSALFLALALLLPAGDPNWRLAPWPRLCYAPAGGRSRGGGSLRGSRLAFSGGGHTGTTCRSICSPACCRCSCKVNGKVSRRGPVAAPGALQNAHLLQWWQVPVERARRPGVSQVAAVSLRRGEQRTALAAKVPLAVGPLVWCRSLLWRAVHHKAKWPRQTRGLGDQRYSTARRPASAGHCRDGHGPARGNGSPEPPGVATRGRQRDKGEGTRRRRHTHHWLPGHVSPRRLLRLAPV